MKRFVLVAFLGLFLAPAFGQNPDAQRAALDKLSFLEGEWTGTAWAILEDGSRIDLNQHEKVTRKAGGLMLAIEGTGTDPSSGDVSYEAFATVYQDFQTGQLKMFGGTSDGRNGEMEIVLTDDQARWSPRGMGANVRYTITLTEDGRWLEKGEFSPDGQNWIQFFEMTLRKID